MIICKVKGNVVSTNKTEKLTGLKLMLVQQYDVVKKKEEGSMFVAVDTVGAGDDEIVMVVRGSSARQTMQTDQKPVDASIVGIVDSIEVDGKVVFKKYK